MEPNNKSDESKLQFLTVNDIDWIQSIHRYLKANLETTRPKISKNDFKSQSSADKTY